MKYIIILLILFITLSGTYLHAQGLRNNFSPVVKGYPLVRTIEIQSDDKIYLTGDDISFVGDIRTQGIIRLNKDLSLDETFMPELTASNTQVFWGIHASEDSVILLTTTKEIFVMKKNGELDDGFNIDDQFYNFAGATTIGDGYLIGAWSNLHNTYRLVKVNRDGSIDDSFIQTSVMFGNLQQEVIILPDGKILVRGPIQLNGEDIAGIIQLNTDGSVDNTFNTGTKINGGFIRDFAIQPDGKIVVVGFFEEYNGTIATNGMIRLNSDGTIDESFAIGTTSNIASSGLYGVEVDDNGKIHVIGREFDNGWETRLFRLNSDGTFDAGFQVAKMNDFNNLGNLAIQMNSENNTFVAGGIITANEDKRLGIAGFSNEGDVLQIDAHLSGKPALFSAAFPTDSTILIGGEFYEVNGTEVHSLARLNMDGSLDETFNVDLNLSDPNDNKIRDLKVLGNGKILVGGQVTYNSQGNTTKLIRLNSDGSYDDSFQQNIFGNGEVEEILVDGNGIITVAGDIAAIGRTDIVQLNPDGSVFDSFSTENLFTANEDVNHARYSNDGKIVISGYDPNVSQGFAYKVNPDGSRDDTFTQNFDNLNVQTSVEIGGFSLYGGWHLASGPINQSGPIYKVDMNLLKDEFTFGVVDEDGFNMCQDILTLDESSFIIGGNFTEVNGVKRKDLARLDVDGGVDPFFDFDISGRVYRVKKIDEENILIVGDFISIDEVTATGVAILSLVNSEPVLLGAINDLSTPEDVQIEVQASDLNIEDPDNQPDDFQISLLSGENYTTNGAKLTPALNYNGILTVPVFVSDGQAASDTLNINIEVLPVNDAPIVIGQLDYNIFADSVLSFELSDFEVVDPDNTFPEGFSLDVKPGEDYQLNGSSISLDPLYSGLLEVPVTVSDGIDEGPVYNVKVNVVSTVTSINSDRFFSNTKLWPNPSSGFLNLSLNSVWTGRIKIEITNQIGQGLYEQSYIKRDTNFHFELDLNSLEKGLYMLRITRDGEIGSTIRFVLE